MSKPPPSPLKLRAGRDPETNAYRLIHGEADGWKELYVDRLGDFLLMQSPQPLSDPQIDVAKDWKNRLNLKGVYYKRLNRTVQSSKNTDSSPRLLMGLEAPDIFEVRESGATFLLSLNQGYSTGLFLDMRENRQRTLNNRIEPGFPVFQSAPANATVLNCFAYTCAFSVCAARAGATTTNLDLSRKYFDWGQDNLRQNGADPGHHDFIYGDALDWMKRLAKRGDTYDLVILVPPTFSRSKKSGVFQAKRDYPALAKAAAPLLRKGAMLLACCNATGYPGKKFKEDVRIGIRSAGRKIVKSFAAPQPPDFPVTAREPAHLKVSWLRLD